MDTTPEMPAIARRKVAAAEFRLGEPAALPLDDASVDTVVCGLALTHQPALRPVLDEFHRVLRPGGHLVTSDIHVVSLYFGGVAGAVDEDGRRGLMPAHRLLPSAYLTEALAAGFRVLGCAEPRWDGGPGAGGPLATRWCPEAATAVYRGLPAAIVWHFVKH